MTIAHFIKATFNSFSQALTLAWKIVKANMKKLTKIKFAKKCGEVRTATMKYASLDTLSKGYVRFLEVLADGQEQWRSFRLERVIF